MHGDKAEGQLYIVHAAAPHEPFSRADDGRGKHLGVIHQKILDREKQSPDQELGNGPHQQDQDQGKCENGLGFLENKHCQNGQGTDRIQKCEKGADHHGAVLVFPVVAEEGKDARFVAELHVQIYGLEADLENAHNDGHHEIDQDGKNQGCGFVFRKAEGG